MDFRMWTNMQQVGSVGSVCRDKVVQALKEMTTRKPFVPPDIYIYIITTVPNIQKQMCFI